MGKFTRSNTYEETRSKFKVVASERFHHGATPVVKVNIEGEDMGTLLMNRPQDIVSFLALVEELKKWWEGRTRV